jgi:hypothetical protein
MNARMIFGFFWLGLVSLLSYVPGVSYYLLAGNVVIALVVLIWGMAAKGYFRRGNAIHD